MIGLSLVLASTFFKEIGTAIGKKKMMAGKESIYTMGFLNMLFGSIFFLLIAIFYRGEFIFSLESIPTLGLRIGLEIAQISISILAIKKATRSTFGFVRIGTIPLLLMVDLILGYTIGFNQFIGIGIIILGFIVLLINHGLKKKGIWLVIFTMVNAVATISLFKYNITHFNSVETEQIIVMSVLMIYMLFMASTFAREHPVQFLKKRAFFMQSFSAGIATVLLSFAYTFAAASVITAGKRSLALMWAMLSGSFYFKEKKLLTKIIAFLLITIGLVFLALQ